MKNTISMCCATVAVAFLISACCHLGGDAANAANVAALTARVKADFAGKESPVYHYAVPPMSDVQRLPDVYPFDGTPGGTVNIVTARDEFEPGSFLVWANRDLGKVSFKLTEFKNEKGEAFPQDKLDLKFIKVWYQNRNGWFSYFGDTGFKLCPELLVNDEDLIRVDTEKKANYARLVDKNGKKSEYWLNPPREFDKRQLTETWRFGERFHCMREDFRDAETLQPVNLPKGEFRNFFLTVHAAKDAKPGLYKGAVRMTAKNGTALGEIPVAIRVLDFALPQPKCYGDPSKDFLVSSYSYISFDLIREVNGYNLPLAHEQFYKVLKNQVEHNQTMHMIRGNMNNEAFATAEIMRKAGMRMDVFQGLAGCFGIKPENQPAHAQRVTDELDRRYGHHNVYMGYGDEPGAGWLVKNRGVFENYQNAGLKFFLAGGNQVFYKTGYLYDWHNIAKDATDDSSTRLWNSINNHNRIAWYAQHHIGTENPSYNRRANGLAAYLSGYTALCNYAHHFGPYNDDRTTYKAMVFAYGVYGGVIDTLGWEGFREGIDDIRYATLMTDYARKAQKSDDVKVRHLGGRAMHFLACLDPVAYDQDSARGEMIRYITELKKHVAPYSVKSDMAFDPADAKVGAKRAEDALAAELKTLKADFDKRMAEAKHSSGRNYLQTNKYHSAVAKCYKKYFREQEGGKYLENAGLYNEAFGYYRYMPEDMKRLALKTLADKRYTGSQNGRATAFLTLLSYDLSYAPRFKEVFFGNIKPDDVKGMKRAVGNALSGAFGARRNLIGSERFAAYAAVYDQLSELAAKYDVTNNVAAASNAYQAYMALGRYDDAERAAKSGLADPKGKPVDKFRLGLSAALAKFDGSADKAFKLAKEYTEKSEYKISNKDLVTALTAAGSEIQGLGTREQVVRGLEKYRESLYVPSPKKRYTVKFSDKVITGINDLEAVKAESTFYDRRYGGNLDFLVTDVSSGDRAAGKSKEKLPPPEMRVVADERGIHFLIISKDPKARDIAWGHVNGGSFEAYIAPGANEPYECVMINQKTGHVGIFNTMYDTFGHRRIHQVKNADKFSFDSDFRDDAVVSHLFFSWNAWIERLPRDGSVWEFENMFWNRAGNFCWNGTESIHGRSTWGELEFELTDAQRAKIARRALAYANANYQSEKRCHGGKNGVIAKWADNVLGDPEFYKAKVEPLVKEIDELGKPFAAGMDDATVLKLAETVLPRWNSIVFEIEALRARWLEEKATLSAK